MKILISVSTSRQIAEKYFEKLAIDKAYRQNDMSRETVITLKCSDFLRLATPGTDPEKEQTVKELLEEGMKFNSLPYLGVETKKNGDVEVASNGGDHEGRHRVRALLQLGVEELPIRLFSNETGGRSYRWRSTQDRPKLLYGYNGFHIPFPPIET